MRPDARKVTRAERLVHHVHELERLVARRADAAESLKRGFDDAKHEGFDTQTLKVVLKLRTMTSHQRRERRALESIYMAALGMLDGDALTDEARRRLDPSSEASPEERGGSPAPPPEHAPSEPARPQQAPLALKDPSEAREEGAAAAAAGQRVYDNPYPAGDPCRAAWDEGWCAQKKSHGMDLPEAYARRTAKPPADAPEPLPAPAPKKGRSR